MKATRAEGLGALGRAEGIACTAVVLLARPTRPEGTGREPAQERRGAGKAGPGRSGRGRSAGNPPTAARGRRAPWSGAPRPGDRGRAGGRTAAGPRRVRPPSGLGGDQVEGRQAVRELLSANRRAVTSLLMAEGMDDPAILDEIEALATTRRVRVEYVSRRRIDPVARTERPQGVVALARPVEETPLEALCGPSDGAGCRSCWSWTASPTPTTSARSCGAPSAPE